MHLRPGRILALVVWLLSLLAAAASGAGPDAAARSAVLRFGVHVDAAGRLDPHFAAGSQDRAVADMLFNGLLRYEPGRAPHIEADLAREMPRFHMEGGRQIWTVELRRGVRFHAGPVTPAYELTAEDVVYSLRKSADGRRCAYAGEYTGMRFEAAGPYTVRILLDKPLSPTLFLPKLTDYAGGFIVSKRAVEAMGDQGFRRHPVGTGPFAFSGHQPGEKLVLKAHREYFRGRPRLSGVAVHYISDPRQRAAAFLAGDLDVIAAPGYPGGIEAMENRPGVVIDIHGVGEVIAVHLNTAMAPLDDARVRRAVAYALDREGFFAASTPRFLGIVYSPVPAQFLPGGLDREEAVALGIDYANDLEKARRLLAEAGYPEGFELTLVGSDKRLYRRCYEVLRAQLARVGIRCRIRPAGHSEMHKRIRTRPPHLVVYVAWRPNADAYLTRFFHSDSIVVTGARPDTNFSHYDKIDRLIEDARHEIEPGKQVNLWKQAQIRLLDDMAAYPVMYTNQCFVRRAHVDYGHALSSTMALYPQFTEKTRILGDGQASP